MSSASRRILSYGVAIASTLLALLLMILLNPWFQTVQTPFLLFFGAITLSAWYGGIRPGIAATLLSAVLANYFFFKPEYRLSFERTENLRMLLFIIQGFVISYLCGALQEAQKQTERSLQQARASEAKFRRLADSNIIGVITADIHGAILDANDAFLKMIGYSPSDLLAGRVRWDEMTPPDLQHLDRPALEELRDRGVHRPFEKAYISKDGRRVPILVGSALLEDASHEKVICFILDLTERKQAEAALRESEERYRQIAENLVETVFWVLELGKRQFLYVSPAYERIWGLPSTNLYVNFEGWMEIVDRQERQRVHEAFFAQALAGRYEQEYQIIRPDGQRRWIRDRSFPIDGHLEFPQRWVRISEDITERRQAQVERERLLQELATERLRLETVLRQLPAGVMIADAASGELILANEQVEAITGQLYQPGYRIEEYGQIGSFTGSTPDGRRYAPDEWPLVRSLKTGEVIVNEEIKLERRDGSHVFIEANAAPIRDGQGELVAAVVVFQDITERQKTELALRQNETLLNTFLAGSPVGLAFLDRSLRYIHINQALATINGLPLEAHLGRTLWEVLPDRAAQEAVIFQQVMAAQKPLLGREITGRATPQSAYRHCLVNVYPVCLSDGDVLGVGVTSVDITELKETEQALRDSEADAKAVNASLKQTTELLAKRNQELDRFAYVVSHDLKAPLRAIANLSVWIEEDLGGQLPEETQYHMELLRRRVYRLEALIEGLLAYSRIGRVEVAQVNTDVRQLLEEIIETLMPPSTFSFEIQALMPCFVTRQLLLSQVFANLIGNAIKHHERLDGRVEIASIDRGDSYEFTITDDGPGIAPEYHKKIFGIFQTLKARDVQENTGIGLSIVTKIVETEGGTIQVESAEGRGSTFRFTWPKNTIKSIAQAG